MIGIGDDCAFLPPDLVLTTDMLVEGVHFDLDYLSLSDVGHRATTACLSDLAAVGARATGILLSIGLKPDLDYQDFKNLSLGIKRVLRRTGSVLLGGDISQSEKMVLSLFAVGKTKSPVLRSGARVGDILYLSGYSGLAEAGRMILNYGIPQSKYPESVRRHRKPYPKIDLGLRLRKKVNAMIDLSDGLLLDLDHIATESRVGIMLDQVPIHPELSRLEERTGTSALALALSGGEDFELIFTSSKRLRRFYRIGRVIQKQGIWYQGKRLRPTGYEHFQEGPDWKKMI